MTKKNASKFTWARLGPLTVLLLILALPLQGGAADIEIFAEGAYTDDDFEVYLYADIATPIKLISFCVTVGYDPDDLEVQSAEKNKEVWYMGEADGVKYDYMDPVDDGSGKCVIIGGKLDVDAPLAGVVGSRVYLGKILFDRLTDTPPTITLAHGRETPFSNYVDVDGKVYEQQASGVSYHHFVDNNTNKTKFAERCDANYDGYLTSTDFFKMKLFIQDGKYVCFADCNRDGYLTSTDFFVLKNKL